MANTLQNIILGKTPSDGVSAQTTKELMRLGIHPSQDKKETPSKQQTHYKDTGLSQQEEYAKRFGPEALKLKMQNQALQKELLIRRMQQEKQRLQPIPAEVLQQAVISAAQYLQQNQTETE